MRLRPRFSMRTLAIVVTLICAYLGAWEATKRYGVEKSRSETSPAPFVVSRPAAVSIGWDYWTKGSHHYVWLLGLKIKLPIETVRELHRRQRDVPLV